MTLQNKRGQITIFIIIGILILVAISVLFIVSKDQSQVDSQDVVDYLQISNNVESYVSSCLKTTTRAAILHIEKQGGYFQLPENSFSDKPVYFDRGEILAPTKETVEEQLSKQIEEELDGCIAEFSYFEDQGIIISYEEKEVISELLDNHVNVKLVWPLDIKQDRAETKMEMFQISEPTKLLPLLETAHSFINEENTEALCVSCLTMDTFANGFKSKIATSPEGYFIITLQDFQSEINNQHEQLRFVNIYELKEEN